MTYHPFDWRLNDLTGGRGPRSDVRWTFQLTDKVAVVTGSSRGLGLASARALVAEGCRVCLCARGPEQLAGRPSKSRPRARRPNMVHDGAGRRLDRRRHRARRSTATVETFGGLDILVNNVGRAAGADLLDTATPNGRRRSTRRCFRRFAPRGSPCRT